MQDAVQSRKLLYQRNFRIGILCVPQTGIAWDALSMCPW